MSYMIARLGLIDDEAIALDEAALALAELDHPGTDLDPYLAEIDEMSIELLSRSAGVNSPDAQAALLAAVIAAEHGYAGDRDTYEDAANADLIRVIERRRGLPVALSILYVALARRIGWAAEALNTPGHLLVRIGDEGRQVVVDPFNGGEVVGARELARLFAPFHLPRNPTLDDFEPLSNQATLVRLLANQAERARSGGRLERALTLYARMTTVAPTLTALWWARAGLELELGDPAAARASLVSMLETTRDSSVRAQARAMLAKLAPSRS